MNNGSAERFMNHGKKNSAKSVPPPASSPAPMPMSTSPGGERCCQTSGRPAVAMPTTRMPTPKPTSTLIRTLITPRPNASTMRVKSFMTKPRVAGKYQGRSTICLIPVGACFGIRHSSFGIRASQFVLCSADKLLGNIFTILPLRPRQYYLAAVAAAHGLEPLFEIGVSKAMRDDRPDVEARLQHHGHLIPGLVHFAAIDALERQNVEDDRVPVVGEFIIRNAEDGGLAAVGHVGEHVAESGGVAGHFQADVKALLHA